MSATKCGLLPISSEAAILGEISYCDFHGVPSDQSERELISRSLGPRNKVLFFCVIYLLLWNDVEMDSIAMNRNFFRLI